LFGKKGLFGFEAFGAFRNANQLLAMNQRMALFASESAQRQACATIVAITDGFWEVVGHGCGKRTA
jgi:hypothetical protein